MKEYFACIGDAVACQYKLPNNTLIPGKAAIQRVVAIERPKINGREIALVGDNLTFDNGKFWPLTDQEGFLNIKVQGISVAKAKKIPAVATVELIIPPNPQWLPLEMLVKVDE